MKLYGIFDKLENYKLLRYSTAPISESIIEMAVPETKSYKTVHEICLSNIEYSEENIGKYYDPETQSFS